MARGTCPKGTLTLRKNEDGQRLIADMLEDLSNTSQGL
jgi:hypothetical protein